MNPFEFVSKTMLVYSFRRKNERIDLSQLPDDIFDKVLLGLSSTNMCQEGSVFTGKFIMDKEKATRFVTMLETDVAPTYPRIRQLIAYLHALEDGDVFRIVSEDAPTMNKQLAILKTNGQKTGENEQVIHNRYLLAWGPLTTTFRHLAFGYDGIRTVIGEGEKVKRVCRFCGRRIPDVAFKEVAHAISEGLGNKLLICNEECDACNNKLSKLESNLMHYLDIQRAMGGILTKTDGAVPSVDGKRFVIRGDENNQAVLYIEQESLPVDMDLSQPFRIQLETNEIITHQGIYKSLCKMVIDLLPSTELSHFGETIGLINGSVMDNELPPYWATYDRESVKQPTVDVFLSNRPGEEPYCTAVAHILDVLFVFILPEVDVDKGRFKTEDAIKAHIQKFTNPYGGEWQEEDSSEYGPANPWSLWLVKPNDPHVQIRPKTDPVFMRYEKEEKVRNEKAFSPFVKDGISDAVISDVKYERHSMETVTIEELHQVSVNNRRMVCLLDKASSKACFTIDLNFSDSSNRLSYFDFSFAAEVRLDDFDKYIETGAYYCIDYHLRDYLCEIVMDAADRFLKQYTAGSDLELVTLKRIIDHRTIRQLYYQVPVGEDKYLYVKDAEIHNI